MSTLLIPVKMSLNLKTGGGGEKSSSREEFCDSPSSSSSGDEDGVLIDTEAMSEPSSSPISIGKSSSGERFHSYHHHEGILISSPGGSSYNSEHEQSEINPKCHEHEQQGKRQKMNCRVNYDSVSSLSVSSSPEQSHHEEVSSPAPSWLIRNSSPLILDLKQRKDNSSTSSNNNGNISAPRKDKSNRFIHDQAAAEKAVNISSSSGRGKLSFGIDRILSDGNNSDLKRNYKDPSTTTGEDPHHRPSNLSPLLPPSSHVSSSSSVIIKPSFPNHHHNQNSNPLRHPHPHHLGHHHPPSLLNPLSSPSSNCAECYFLGRFCGGPVISGGPSSGISASSFSPWISYENSPLLSPSAHHHNPYHPSSVASGLPATYGLNTSTFSTMSSLVGCNTVTASGGRRKRSWSRAVFSSLQRKGLEKRFQIQKYITKPDRRQLAATLGLTDAQVKVWFQNRRMKWRHSKEGKVTSGVGDGISSTTTTSNKDSSTSNSNATTTVADKKQ